MENLCAVPLVMDYLSNRFTCGLPDLGDTNRILRNDDELEILAHSGDDPTNRSLCIGDPEIDDNLWSLFQGVPVENIPALTVLPGAQFVITGLLTKNQSYYRVPVMRMAMDFVVYLVMLVAYYSWVLLYEDGPVTLGEVLFACYVLVSLEIFLLRSYSTACSSPIDRILYDQLFGSLIVNREDMRKMNSIRGSRRVRLTAANWGFNLRK